MTPTEIGALGALGTAALAGLIKFGTWVFAEQAKKSGERRIDMTALINRQDEEIKGFRAELREAADECERRVKELSERVERADLARAQMEGVLARMGWERSPEGRWRRNGEGDKP